MLHRAATDDRARYAADVVCAADAADAVAVFHRARVDAPCHTADIIAG